MEQVDGSLQCPEVNGFIAAVEEEMHEMTEAEINEAVKGFNKFHAGCTSCKKKSEMEPGNDAPTAADRAGR